MLSQLVREASKEVHVAAERSPFMAALMQGDLPSEAYFDYIGQLAPIYEAIEKWNSTELPFFDRRLDRFERIIADLEYVGTRVVCDETIEYVKHIKKIIRQKDEVRLLAHHYTRYLGDLSGGQAIGALVARNLSIPPNFLSFYDFDDIGDRVRYKETYRENLDTVIDPKDHQKFIDEVILAFEYNKKIFDALGKKWLKI
ncbi:MAG: biliverdin-producing heme oxygenase [Actinobacteria bacterium]|nr:biliverdin-producing heme oxygenase [Actinomycetota bacterium]